MDKDLELINQKLDLITDQLAQTARRQRELEELQKDLTPIFSDVFRLTVKELDELSPYFTYEDLLYLLKKVLRNTRNITAMIEQVENASDFVKDAMPLSKPLFQSTLEKLDELEHKGYFHAIKTAGQITDKLVTSLEKEELDNLAQNIDMVIKGVKAVSTDDFNQKLKAAADEYESAKNSKVSWFKVIKSLNDPQIRQEFFAWISAFKKITN